MNDSTVHVGLDVHQGSIVAAYASGLGEVQNLGNIGARPHDLDRWCTRLRSKGSRVCCVYEAGNTYARKVLIEAAWSYRFPAKVSRIIQVRHEGLPSRSSSAPGTPNCACVIATAA